MAAATWCGLIFGSSSTVILPHRFFAWIASHVLSDPEALRKFIVFWGYTWFAIVKGWHAAEYAILYMITRAVLDRMARSRARRNTALAMAFCLLFAISDEYHQTFVPGRGGTWTDVAIDGLGAGLAALVSYPRRNHPAGAAIVNLNPEDSWTSDALGRGDLAAVRRRVLDDPAYLTARDFVGDTPLLSAVGYNDVDLIRFMIEHGADPDPIVDDGYTSLLSAIESTDPASIEIVSTPDRSRGRHSPDRYERMDPAPHGGRSRPRREGPITHRGGGEGRPAYRDRRGRNAVDGSRKPGVRGDGATSARERRRSHPEGHLSRTNRARDRRILQEKGPTPAFSEHIESVDYGPIHAEVLASLEVPPDMREMVESIFANLDMADQYREAADKVAREGDFEEVIRLLSESLGRR